MLIAVRYMSVDMAQWSVIVLFNIMAFGGAYRVLYGDKYKGPAYTQGEECIVGSARIEPGRH
eukprot:2481992-Prymnesium_polylepis.1